MGSHPKGAIGSIYLCAAPCLYDFDVAEVQYGGKKLKD